MQVHLIFLATADPESRERSNKPGDNGGGRMLK